jgi:biotin transport system substrate-specific component
LAAALVGRLAERGWDRHPASSAGLMALGNFVIYLVGVPVLAIIGGLSAGQAIWSGALVFLAWDAAKIAAAAVLLPLAWRVTGERR